MDDSIYSLTLLNDTISNVEKILELSRELKSKDFKDIGQIRMFKGQHESMMYY